MTAPLFEATLPGASLKRFANLLACLARIGDDLFLEASADKLLFSTINSSRSAFAIATFRKEDFDAYRLGGGANGVAAGNSPPQRCKILMKAFVNVFKTKANMDQNVERCKLSLATSYSGVGSFVHVQMHCKYGIVKTFKLIYEPCEPMHAVYDRRSCMHTWQTSPRTIADWLQHFHTKQDEVTMACGNGWARFRTSDGNVETAAVTDDSKRALHTEISLEPEDFDIFTVEEDVSLTFNLKEFKAILTFGESIHLPVTAFFQGGGSPILFAIDSGGGSGAEFVLATITDDSEASQDSSRPLQSHTSQYSHGGFGSMPSGHDRPSVNNTSAASSQAQSAAHPSGSRTNSRRTVERAPSSSMRSNRTEEVPTPRHVISHLSPSTDRDSAPREMQLPQMASSAGAVADSYYDEDGSVPPSFDDDEFVPPTPPRKKVRTLFG